MSVNNIIADLEGLSVSNTNKDATTSPARLNRSQADDARAYRREHDLCFYCGGKEHSLKDCHFAPHNRGMGTYNPPSRNSSSSTFDGGRTLSGRSRRNGNANSNNETVVPPVIRPDPGLLRRLGLTGTPPADLTETQWSECLNATSAIHPTDEFDYSQVTIDQAIDALKRYIMIRYPEPVASRCPSPHMALDESDRKRIATEVRNWECLPGDIKIKAVEMVKKTEEEKLMAALDVVGEKIMKDAPVEVKRMFEAVLEFCVKDD